MNPNYFMILLLLTSSKIYQHIRNLSSIPSTMFYESASATNDIHKASLFNKYFNSVFSTSTTSTPSTNESLDTDVHHHLVSIDLTNEDTYNALISLDLHKTTGIDGIGPQLLKNCAPLLYGPLNFLFNLTLLKHTIPLEWCTHCIVPVFKSGDRGSVSNYRPISLLCNTSKILEKLVYDKVIHHLNPLVTTFQFGFFKNRSVTQQLLIVFNNIIYTSHQMDIVYLDFRKAFDSVSHNILLLKLKRFGISGKLWQWFKFYF